MNVALIRKTIRDYRLLAAGAILVLFVFVVLFMFAISSMPLKDIHYWSDIPWIRKLLNAMMGTDIGDMFSRTGIASFVYTHMLMWVIVIGFMLTMASGVLSGEIDRGTMDLLATLPVSRTHIYTSLSLVALLFGLPLCWTIWLGIWLGRSLVGWNDVRLDLLAMLTCHLYAVYIFLTGFSMAVSAMCSRRTVALVICFGMFFYPFVLNLIGAFWPPAAKIAFTGFFYYYAPLLIIRYHIWMWHDIGVLLSVGAVAWGIGWIFFVRRDVPAT